MKALAIVVLCLVYRFAAQEPRMEAVKAVSADAFVDSVGVNIHLHYNDTPYGDFAAVSKAIETLGVRHVRDGLIDTSWAPYYERLNELGRMGVKATLITSPKESETLLVDYPRRVRDGFEAYEAPNEYDQSGDADWAGTLKVFVAKLHKAVKSDPATAAFPIIGPSLTQETSFRKMIDTQQYFDFANLHNYLGGRNPGTSGWGDNGYGSYEWNLKLVSQAWPGKAVVTTETGYFNDKDKTNGVPEEVSGKYLPRLLFEQVRHGIQRTFIYELLDTGKKGQAGDTTYGLLRADFSPKPAFNALKNVLQLLEGSRPSIRHRAIADDAFRKSGKCSRCIATEAQWHFLSSDLGRSARIRRELQETNQGARAEGNHSTPGGR